MIIFLLRLFLGFLPRNAIFKFVFLGFTDGEEKEECEVDEVDSADLSTRYAPYCFYFKTSRYVNVLFI